MYSFTESKILIVYASISLCHCDELVYFICQCLVRWNKADCQIRRDCSTSFIDKFSEYTGIQ